MSGMIAEAQLGQIAGRNRSRQCMGLSNRTSLGDLKRPRGSSEKALIFIQLFLTVEPTKTGTSYSFIIVTFIFWIEFIFSSSIGDETYEIIRCESIIKHSQWN